MTIKIVCPICQNHFELRHGENGADIDELITQAAKLGQHWAIACEYVLTHRADRFNANMTLKKRLRLLKEVQRLFELQEFEYEGERYRIGRAGIVAAMKKVCNAEKWGLKNLNYLMTIMRQDAERLSAEGLTAKEEALREKMRRDRVSRKSAEAQGKDRPISVDEHKAKRGIESLADNIGKSIDQR